MTKSPLEGIWKITKFPSDYYMYYDNTPPEAFFLFTGDIFAASEDSKYLGCKIVFNNEQFHPPREYFEYISDTSLSDAELLELALTYNRVSESSLTIWDDEEGEEYKLIKIY